jgi:hypothetical protein
MYSGFEYHVGLDYTQSLFIPTVFEEQDGEIIALNNETGIAEKSVSLDIEPRLDGIPEDIQSSTQPTHSSRSYRLGRHARVRRFLLNFCSRRRSSQCS